MEIRLWCAFYGEIDDERLLGEYRQMLSESERAQERRFYFADDRRRYLVTRALVRTVLSRTVLAGRKSETNARWPGRYRSTSATPSK
jgi:phosphopantetheinyl transferase